MKRVVSGLLATLMLFGLTACGGGDTASSAAASSAVVSSGAAEPESAAQDEAAPLALPEDDGGRVDSDGSLAGLLNAFASNTAGAVMDAGSNNCYSPASLYMALALVTAGAGGETLDVMLDLLGAADADTLHAMMGQAMAALPFDGHSVMEDWYLEEMLWEYEEGWLDLPEGLSEEELAEAVAGGSRLELANSVWLNSLKYPGGYIPAFETVATRDYHALLEAVPFGQPATDQALNGWISENTGGLIDAGFETNKDHAMILVNTVYYLDRWEAVFDPADNTTEPFTFADGSEEDREYMNMTLGGHRYYTGPGFTASSLWLENGSMTFILPDEGVAPAELLATPRRVNALLQPEEQAFAEVIFQIPKFTFETELKPKDALMAMGYTLPFTHPEADFLGISPTSGPDQLPYIDDIIQQTTIRVDEEGAEAAAATMALIPDTAVMMPEEDPPVVELRLTRPFIFVLWRDMLTDDDYLGQVPMFIGVVNNPTF